MKKYVISAAVTSLLVFTPFMAIADTASVTDLQNQIKSLMEQIKTLQGQIRVIQTGTSTPARGEVRGDVHFTVNSMPGMPAMSGMTMGTIKIDRCPELPRNLGVGSRGEDVKQLQLILAEDSSIYAGTTTGFFGPETAKAVARFQAKFGIASSSTGFVGNITRDFVGRRCGVGITPFQIDEHGALAAMVVLGTVSANDGITLTINTKDSSKSFAIATTTRFLKWTGTTTPPTVGVATDAIAGSKVIVESTQVNGRAWVTNTVRIGFPVPVEMNGMPGMPVKIEMSEGMKGRMMVSTSTMAPGGNMWYLRDSEPERR